MDDIYLFSLSLEQHHTASLQTVGTQMSGWIEQHPTVQQVAKVKNDIAAPVESFYERELRFGTKAYGANRKRRTKHDRLLNPPKNQSLTTPVEDESTFRTEHRLTKALS